jgi:hypothetical protein
MRTFVIAVTFALLAAGGAAAGEPMVLSAEQLDRVTAGSHVRISLGLESDIGEFVLRVETPGITAVKKTAASPSGGGGIFNNGTLTITHSTITRHTPVWTDFNVHDPGQTD